MGNENGWQADREHFEHYADEELKPAPAVFESTKEAVRLGQVSLNRDMLTHGGPVCMVPAWALRVLVGCWQRQQQPAPLPLPDNVHRAILNIKHDTNRQKKLFTELDGMDVRIVLQHITAQQEYITAQARLLAEVEAERDSIKGVYENPKCNP